MWRRSHADPLSGQLSISLRRISLPQRRVFLFQAGVSPKTCAISSCWRLRLLLGAAWLRFVSRIPPARCRLPSEIPSLAPGPRSAVELAPHAAAAAVDDVGVDHGRAHVAVAEQLLDGVDVIPIFR